MLFLIAVSVLLASANAKLYTDCGSKLATVHTVTVSGCSEDSQECVLKRNSNVSVSIDFTPSHEVKTIETVVHGIIMGLPVPFPLPQPDACKDNGLACPLKADQVANYKANMPVLKSYPKIKLDVKWELMSEHGDDLVCIMIPTRIH